MENSIITIEDRKEKIVDKLSTQYSLNQISMEEYERLIKYSQNIETEKELQILETIVNAYNTQDKRADNINAQQTNMSDNTGFSDTNSRDHLILLSSRKTTGAITGGNFTNILSDHKIIITEEDLLNNETVLNFIVLLGSVTIQIPDTVEVINKTMTILSDVSISENNSTNKVCGSRKKLILMGNILLGDIKVKVMK